MLDQLLRKAAGAAGAVLLSVHTHRFELHGVSAVAILAESHLAVHTWPELGYAAMDAFTWRPYGPGQGCGRVGERPERRQCTTVEMTRGIYHAPAAHRYMGAGFRRSAGKTGLGPVEKEFISIMRRKRPLGRQWG